MRQSWNEKEDLRYVKLYEDDYFILVAAHIM